MQLTLPQLRLIEVSFKRIVVTSTAGRKYGLERLAMELIPLRVSALGARSKKNRTDQPANYKPATY